MNSLKSKSAFRFSYVFVSLVAVTAINFVAPESALAANVGSGNCIQVVDSASDVAAVESGGFCYVAFRAGTRVWNTPINASSIDFLIVAGGGSGGSRHAGGGGAGGLIRGTNVSISGVTALNISVGAGAPAPSRVSGNNFILGGTGSNSFLSRNSGVGGFTTRTAVGGGGGAAGGNEPQYGGSGGGSQSGTVSTFESGQGNAGGTGGYSAGYWYSSGGGGGAGGVGLNHTSTSGGAGGPGAIWISDFTTTIATGLGLAQTRQVSGNQVHFAGGGGGSTTSTTAGGGGLGGGGAAVLGNSTGESGGVNSGGGGGGSGCCDGGTPGAGGSGVVLIRYAPDTTAPTFSNSTTFSLNENSPITTNAATVTVTESATITINSGNDSALFSLVTSDSLTARIRFLASPNFEAPIDVGPNNVYDISVRATDAAGNFANQSIAITITNVNEAPSITNNSSNPTASLSQAENMTSVTTFAATDPDAGAVLRFSISGTDASVFTIDSVTGVLTFAINPDFEAPLDSDTNSVYVVAVNVSDGTLTDIQTLTVTITNVNEASTVGAPTFSAATVKGVTLTISVTSNVAGRARFFVNGKRIPACLSRSTTGTYPNFSVTCSWKPPVTGRQSVSAAFTPTDNSFTASTSPVTTIQVTKRATNR